MNVFLLGTFRAAVDFIQLQLIIHVLEILAAPASLAAPILAVVTPAQENCIHQRRYTTDNRHHARLPERKNSRWRVADPMYHEHRACSTSCNGW